MGTRLHNEQDQVAERLRGDNFSSMGLDWNILGTGTGNGSMSDSDIAGQMIQDLFRSLRLRFWKHDTRHRQSDNDLQR